MRLDQELTRRGLCESRTEAQQLIVQGSVLVNGIVCTKQVRTVTDTDDILVTSRRKFVSRGGEKLEGVLLDLFGTEEGACAFVSGKRCLDVGSSTGGFTHCLLQYGARHIDAVDVGTDQLHGSLRNNTQVVLFEQTDIRSFLPASSYDIIVADLSFIPLEQVLPGCVRFGKVGTLYILLIKPQFEVGRGNTKKGIVKDLELVTLLLSKYAALVERSGMKNVRIFPCHIQGGDGNQEYFLVGIKE